MTYFIGYEGDGLGRSVGHLFSRTGPHRNNSNIKTNTTPNPSCIIVSFALCPSVTALIGHGFRRELCPVSDKICPTLPQKPPVTTGEQH